MVATDSRLAELALQVRVADELGRLDVAATAARNHVEVRTTDLAGSAEAVAIDGRIILHHGFTSEGRRRFVFAHELAHLLVERGAMPWVTRRREEQWADWFAHECVMPSRILRDRHWAQLRLFDDPAEQRTLAMHLASRAREQPTVLRVDGTVVCGSCGDRSFNPECACEEFRHNSSARGRLPEMRPITSVNLNQLQLFATADDPFRALWREIVGSGDVVAAI
jgi:hypothetical protein